MIIRNRDLMYYQQRRNQCEWCGKPPFSGYLLEPHHVIRRGLGGGSQCDTLLNTIAVHRRCHQEIEALGADGNKRCWYIIERREGLAPGQAEEAVWRLLRRDQFTGEDRP